MMTKLRVQAVATAILVALTVGAAPVQAAKSDGFAKDTAKAEAIAQTLRNANASQTAIDAALRAQLGWQRADVVEPSVEPMSSIQTDATVPPPTLYHSIPGKYWVATATFAWKHNCGLFGNTECWYKDCHAQAPCGGPDGFGVRVQIEVNESATYFTTYDEKGGIKQWSGPDTMSGFGATWTTSDTLNGVQCCSGIGEKYDWDHGTEYYYFNAISCAGKVGTAWRFYSRLNHTWNTTAVTGFGISATGFSVATGGGSDYWPLGTNTPVNAYLCGQ